MQATLPSYVSYNSVPAGHVVANCVPLKALVKVDFATFKPTGNVVDGIYPVRLLQPENIPPNILL